MGDAHIRNIWQQLWYSYRYSTCSAVSTIAHFVTNSVYSRWRITTHRYTTCRWIQYRCIWRSWRMSDIDSNISSCACCCRTTTYAVIGQYISYNTRYCSTCIGISRKVVGYYCWRYICYGYSCSTCYTTCWCSSCTYLVADSIHSIRRCRWYSYHPCIRSKIGYRSPWCCRCRIHYITYTYRTSRTCCWRLCSSIYVSTYKYTMCSGRCTTMGNRSCRYIRFYLWYRNRSHSCLAMNRRAA